MTIDFREVEGRGGDIGLTSNEKFITYYLYDYFN